MLEKTKNIGPVTQQQQPLPADPNIRVVTSASTQQSDDDVVFLDATAGTFTFTTLAVFNKIVFYRCLAGTVTLAGPIETVSLSAGQAIVVCSDGTTWREIA